MLHWTQDDCRLTLHSNLGDFWAEMPSGWHLDQVHPTALRVVEWLLLHKLEAAAGMFPSREEIAAMTPRPRGRRTILCYSAGTDSTAAWTLLPADAIPVYCRRPYTCYRRPDGVAIRLAPFAPIRRCLDSVGNVLEVPNTFETIGLAAGWRHGFCDGYGYAAIACLLADHLEAGAVAFGSVMEQVFLGSGNNYVDIVESPTASWHAYRRLFAAAGLEFCLPTGGCSEVLTSRIVAAGPLADLAVSCPLADADGTPCGRCFKCFRKLRLLQMPAPEPAPTVLATLAKRPLKSASSVIYACQRSGWWHPSLSEYSGVNLSFLDRYHGYGVDRLLPSDLSNHLHRRFAEIGIEPMNPEDERRLRSLGEIFFPTAFERSRAGLPAVRTDSQSLQAAIEE